MNNLTEQEKEKLIKMIKEDRKLPSIYKNKLFSNNSIEFIEATNLHYA